MSATLAPALSPASEKLRGRLDGSPAGQRAELRDLDLPTLEVAPADWPALARWLRDDPECRYDLFLDMAGVDNLKRTGRKTRSTGLAPQTSHALGGGSSIRWSTSNSCPLGHRYS